MGPTSRFFTLLPCLLLSISCLAQGQTAPDSYWTEVALEENGCGDVTVRPGPTDFLRGGADSLTVTHAGQSYRGNITQDGRFTTIPRDLVFGTTVYTIAISGQFAGKGFTSRVSVRVREQGAEGGCSYTVKWTGTP